jgi:hypothetical protein
LNALAILKIQVHRDRGKELADDRRFKLAIKSKFSATRKARGSAGRNFEECPVLAAGSIGQRNTLIF